MLHMSYEKNQKNLLFSIILVRCLIWIPDPYNL